MPIRTPDSNLFAVVNRVEHAQQSAACARRLSTGCSVLGRDPSHWSCPCPLPPMPWFDGELDLFTRAVELVAGGSVERGIAVLRQIRSDELPSLRGMSFAVFWLYRCNWFQYAGAAAKTRRYRSSLGLRAVEGGRCVFKISSFRDNRSITSSREPIIDADYLLIDL